MSAITAMSVAPVAVARVQARKNINGAKVAQKSTVKAVVRSTKVVCKTQDKKMATLAVTAASVAMSLEPLAAQAASTDSLNNMLYSFIAGGVVLAGLLGAVYGVSAFDKVNRS